MSPTELRRVQASHPRQYAYRVFDEGLSTIRSARSTCIDRRDAARTLYHVARCDLDLDERRLTDVMSAIAQRIGESEVVHHLLHLVSRRPRNVEALSPAVVRLCDLAQREHPDSLFQIVAHALRVPAWRRGLRADVVAQLAALRLAAGHARGAVAILAECAKSPLLAECVHLILSQHPRLLADESLSSAERWRMHTAAPTADGWRILASRRGETEGDVRQRGFETAVDMAISSLERAIESEPEGQTRLVLARWRVQLGESR
jgi:hypothetical protein